MGQGALTFFRREVEKLAELRGQPVARGFRQIPPAGDVALDAGALFGGHLVEQGVALLAGIFQALRFGLPRVPHGLLQQVIAG